MDKEGKIILQPVTNLSTLPITVKVALQLVLLINVDEKDQVMHTNVWLTLVSINLPISYIIDIYSEMV